MSAHRLGRIRAFVRALEVIGDVVGEVPKGKTITIQYLHRGKPKVEEFDRVDVQLIDPSQPHEHYWVDEKGLGNDRRAGKADHCAICNMSFIRYSFTERP